MSDAVMVPREPLADLELVVGEIFERWDKDMRSGKLLTALSGLMAPGYDPRVDRIRQALAASTPVGGWEDISTAPDLERVMVCGWSPPHKRVAGYWWWYEDTTHEGRAVEHPTALYWSPINLPVFPPPPSVSTDKGSSILPQTEKRS